MEIDYTRILQFPHFSYESDLVKAVKSERLGSFAKADGRLPICISLYGQTTCLFIQLQWNECS